MSIEKLFKRYLKEIGVYASSEGRESIKFMRTYSPYLPFFAFRWDTSIQGDLYWFERAINWLIYLYNNCDNIDDDLSVTKEEIARRLHLLAIYCKPHNASLKIFAFYDELKGVFSENNMKTNHMFD